MRFFPLVSLFQTDNSPPFVVQCFCFCVCRIANVIRNWENQSERNRNDVCLSVQRLQLRLQLDRSTNIKSNVKLHFKVLCECFRSDSLLFFSIWLCLKINAIDTFGDREKKKKRMISKLTASPFLCLSICLFIRLVRCARHDFFANSFYFFLLSFVCSIVRSCDTCAWPYFVFICQSIFHLLLTERKPTSKTSRPIKQAGLRSIGLLPISNVWQNEWHLCVCVRILLLIFIRQREKSVV